MGVDPPLTSEFVYGMKFCSFSIRLDLAVRWGLFYFTLPDCCPFSFRRYGEVFLWDIPKPPLKGARGVGFRGRSLTY